MLSSIGVKPGWAVAPMNSSGLFSSGLPSKAQSFIGHFAEGFDELRRVKVVDRGRLRTRPQALV